MSSDGSVTQWLHQLRAGDAAATQGLWGRYYQALVELARHKLRGQPRGPADEEDAALSAFDSFCRHAQAGRFPLLQDRDDLWRLLVVITARKVIRLIERERAQKRGGGRVRAEADLPGANDEALARIVGHEPTPAFAAQVAEECQRLLDLLADPQLRAIAVWKMEGHTNDEIAAWLDCSPFTVSRKLGRIRGAWGREVDP
jgi:DNA-directed RNA polymerase specialized sigma24 family protein